MIVLVLVLLAVALAWCGVLLGRRLVAARRERVVSWWPDFERDFRRYVEERAPHGPETH